MGVFLERRRDPFRRPETVPVSGMEASVRCVEDLPMTFMASGRLAERRGPPEPPLPAGAGTL